MGIEEISNIKSRILNLEYIITIEVLNGHKPNIDDKFRDYRTELKILRNQLKIYT